MRPQLLIGAPAMAAANGSEFQSRWQALCRACPWATGCQHPDFVMPWYRLYGARFTPAIVLAWNADGTLAGLCTLAIEVGRRRITAAGAAQAEYQAWLVPAGAGDGFIVAALRLVRQACRGHDIVLRYLAPGAPTAWAGTQHGLGAPVGLRAHARPLMTTSMQDMARQRRKKNHRQNFNRLARLGEVCLTRVRGDAAFAAILDELCAQYDFRQAALYHRRPVASDPARKPLLRELHRRGMLHVTTLTVGARLVAAHAGVLSEHGELHLGMTTHAPAFAAHSPGSLHLAMLGVLLANEASTVLDLTPGGDAYKEHFASSHDLVHELSIYGSSARRWRQQALGLLVRGVKAGLRSAGYRSADLVAAIDAVRARALAGLGTLRAGIRGVVARARVLHFSGAGPGGAGLPLGREDLHHLLAFEGGRSGGRYWQFMRAAMRRMERGERVYTHAQGGRLLLACWLQRGPAGAPFVLYDMYLHAPLAPAVLVRRFVGAIIEDLGAERPGIALQYAGAPGRLLRQVLRDSGFVAAPGLRASDAAALPGGAATAVRGEG